MSTPSSQLVALPNLLVAKHLSPFAFSFNTTQGPVITIASSLLLPTPSFFFFSKHENRAGRLRNPSPG